MHCLHCWVVFRNIYIVFVQSISKSACVRMADSRQSWGYWISCNMQDNPTEKEGSSPVRMHSVPPLPDTDLENRTFPWVFPSKLNFYKVDLSSTAVAMCSCVCVAPSSYISVDFTVLQCHQHWVRHEYFYGDSAFPRDSENWDLREIQFAFAQWHKGILHFSSNYSEAGKDCWVKIKHTLYVIDKEYM